MDLSSSYPLTKAYDLGSRLECHGLDRAAILAVLERQLKKDDKALVGNGGYRRFLATISEKGSRQG
jgi:hypothetical protein